MMRLQPKFFKILLLLFWVTVASQKGSAQELVIKICNKTGYDIDSLKIGNQLIGRLASDSSTTALKLDYFTDGLGLSYFSIRGLIENVFVRNTGDGVVLCDTGMERITKGNFDFDLTLFDFYDGERTWKYFRIDHHL